MLKNIIKNSNLNIYNMMKNGTIASITMLGVALLFGTKNIMLAFPVALTSAVLGRQNFYVKPISKVLQISILDTVIVIMAYLSSLNRWSGIIINFVTIFFIMYMIVSPYDLTFYKPFLMLYIFTQYVTVTLAELPKRIGSVLFGIILITVCNLLLKSKEKTLLGSTINTSLKILAEQSENIINETFDYKLSDKCSNLMRSIAYRVYVSRHKNYLTTNLGVIQFKIYLYIESINMDLGKMYYEKVKCVEGLREVTEILLRIVKCKSNIGKVEDLIKYFELNSTVLKKERFSLYEKIAGVLKAIYDLTEINDNEINRIYEQWGRTKLDSTKEMFFEYLSSKTIRFKFAIRMAVTMTIVLFIGEILGYYKIIWGIITIMSIMQPYYEDTILKAKDRIKGNIIAVIIVGISIDLINNKIFTLVIMVISLYLLYGFKEFWKISLFAASASISIASLNGNVSKLLVYRVVYVILGVILVIIASKLILPYKIADGVDQLILKIKNYNVLLVEYSLRYLNKKVNEGEIRDLIIHLSLLLEKLYLRNLQVGDKRVSEILVVNNKFLIELGYSILYNYDKNDEEALNKLYELINEYRQFNYKISISN